MTALVLIDVQTAFDDPRMGSRNNPYAELRIHELLAAWRASGGPVIHAQHASVEPDSPLRPEAPGFAFKPQALPRAGEPVFRKATNSAFIGTELEAHLRAAGIARLVLAGLTTDHCVSTTARMAANLGFAVTVVADATATFDRTDVHGQRVDAAEVHRIHLASLKGEFCEVLDTAAVVARVHDVAGGP